MNRFHSFGSRAPRPVAAVATTLLVAAMLAAPGTAQSVQSLFVTPNGGAFAARLTSTGELAFHAFSQTPAGMRLDRELGRTSFGAPGRYVQSVEVTPLSDREWIATVTLVNGADGSLAVGRFTRADGGLRMTAAGVVDRLRYRRSVATDDGFADLDLDARAFRRGHLLRFDAGRDVAELVVELPGSHADDMRDANAANEVAGGIVVCELPLRTEHVADGGLSPFVPFDEVAGRWLGAGCDVRVGGDRRQRWIAARITADATSLAPRLQPLRVLAEAADGNFAPLVHAPLAVDTRYAIGRDPSGRLQVAFVRRVEGGSELVRAVREPSGAWSKPAVEGIIVDAGARVVVGKDAGLGLGAWQIGTDDVVRRLSR